MILYNQKLIYKIILTIIFNFNYVKLFQSMYYSAEELMFNSDHFDVNNTNKKLAQLFNELMIEYLLTHLIIYIKLTNQ